MCCASALHSPPIPAPSSSALTWRPHAFFLWHANDPCTGQCTLFFVIGEQKEGIFPEVVYDQVEQEQQQEEAYYEEEAEGGGGVESEQESSDSDDGFTNVLDPLSRQAKELIANDSQVLLATSRYIARTHAPAWQGFCFASFDLGVFAAAFERRRHT